MYFDVTFKAVLSRSYAIYSDLLIIIIIVIYYFIYFFTYYYVWQYVWFC